MHPYTSDTDPDSHAVQMAIFRQMPPQERLAKAFRLSHCVREMARAAIRRRYPEATDAELRIKFIEIYYGKELAKSVQAFLGQDNR